MKKAQIEIIGLAVILIILAIGLIIALTFILKPKTNILEDQRQNIRATSLLNTLIDTNVDLVDKSNTKTVKDLIKECYPNQVTCENQLKMPILNKIFNNQEYIFRIQHSFENTIKITNLNRNDCESDKVVTDPVVIIASPRMEVKLTLCSQKF